MKIYVHYKLVVEVEADNADDAWDQATDILRGGGGDIIGHSIIDQKGNAIEEGGQ
jgi:hypothetical protein